MNDAIKEVKDNFIGNVREGTYIAPTDENGNKISLAENIQNLDTNLARVDQAVGNWTGTVDTTTEVGYGTLEVSSITNALGQINSNIGTSAQIDAAKFNNVSSDQSINANIAAVNNTLGDFSKLNGTIDAETNAKTLSSNLTNGKFGQDGYNVPQTVVDVLNNIDATLGTVHGLAQKLDDAGKYYGNLAQGTSVEQHLTAIDAAIGNRSKISFNADGVTPTYAASSEAMNVSDAISYVASHIGSADFRVKTEKYDENGNFVFDDNGNLSYEQREINGVKANNTVNANIAALNVSVGDVEKLKHAMYAANRDETGNVIATSVTDAVYNLDYNLYDLNNRFNYFAEGTISAVNTLNDHYKRLRKDFQTGMASMAAMSALAPNARATGDTQLSVGTGAYSGHTAAAVGAYHWLTDNLMLNVGAAWGDSSDTIYRMGVTYSW